MTRPSAARRRLLRPCAAAVCAAALLAACTSGSDKPATASSSPSPSAPTSSAAAPASGDQLQREYQSVVKNVLPSVVQITTDSDLGSGIVYDSQGNIVTNAHVVGSAQKFSVTLVTGGNPLDAVLVSSYPAEDLAVIKLSSPPKDLKPAKFGDSAKVEVGQIVLAMGNPLGLSGSVTQGIVSAVGRTVSEGSSNGATGATIANMVQTSAAINPGNSGGALVNLDNEVIGIPTLAATDPQMGAGAAPGIGFAIPSSTVSNIAGQIIKDGKVTNSGRAALGITARTVVGDNLQPSGVAVVSVVDSGAAAKAGLAAGDVITALGGTPVTTMQSLTEALATHKPGDKVQVSFERGGTPKTAEATLGSI
ncbi:trypsin-like peptidase domain-containing protein [Streptomyces sp. H10-C2]|uniref:S1C family serine protease n=1 Tax=unclassified Streptomyces TaxID=2593676 RepID=UPI0024B93E7B|nr:MULTISPECIES: trypsin-like peptidase domain-containing protein [unclassified Streptomyces]MDJ0341165.1 trypsin-like peptidase domain-containing protein [Streptomyces sp. PH10-H1]MDJ0369483.1 trypsin-like peptidase domain-containing protein [Streptomyces sp. H10-C2]